MSYDLDIREFGPCSCNLHNRKTGEIMPHWRSLVPSKYVSHYDLNGSDVVVTIASIKLAEVIGAGGKKSQKALASFVGKEKAMVMGATCLKSIASLYGDDYTAWKGKRVTIYPTTTEASGETVGTIRVRNVAPKGPGAREPQPQIPPPREPGDEAEDRGDEPTAEEMANG
jgi:hypothetical protein